MEDMFVKKCPDCGHEMHSITVATNPPILGYKCMHCGKMLSGFDNKTPGELLKEKESDITNSISKVSPSITRDNPSIKDYIPNCQHNESITAEVKLQPTSSVYDGLLKDIELLRNEHKWAMNELNIEIIARRKAENKLIWMVICSYVIGAVVALVAVNI